MIHHDSPQTQALVHQIETGALRDLVLRIAFFIAVAGIVVMYLMVNFRGLESEQAMDQAQIGRQIASGQGFSTLYVRPAAMWQLLNHREELPRSPQPDIYNFPLNPALDAVALIPVKHSWDIGATEPVYAGDRAIATAGVCLFLAATAIFFILVRRLFDPTIAWLTATLVLLTDLMWRFSVSGLPQMLMLFLFAWATLLLHGAIVARYEERAGGMLLRLAGVAFLLGLMTLAQPMGFWMFIGLLGFVFLWFRPRTVSGLLVFFVYAAVVTPWLARNYLVCGNPLGLGIYSILDGTVGSETAFMSNLQPDLSPFGMVKAKLRGGLVEQFQDLFGYFGYNLAAVAFFFSLLHVFRKSAASTMRWALLLMWLPAAVGMAFFAPRGLVSANQLHVLFLPLFAAYGIAFLLVLWGRLDIRFAPARIAFLSAVLGVSAIPLVLNLLTTPPGSVNWPPYIPPFIRNMCTWMDKNEILATDMPWATAWYGRQESLLLPATPDQFILVSDYKYLGGPIGALYLTPVSGNQPFLSGISKGEYKEWASFIMRNADLSRFPLQFFTPLPLDNECVFYSNRDRWTGHLIPTPE